MTDTALAYRPGDGPLHRLHPVTKALVLGCTVVAAYLAPTPAVAGLLALVVVGAGVAGVVRPVLRASVPVLVPLGVGLFVLHGFFREGGGAFFTLGPATVWRGGVAYAGSVLLTLSTFVLAGVTFVTTTHPRKLLVGLTGVGVPRKVGYAFVASLQLVPELRRRAGRIVDAQRSRGLDTGGSVRDRFRALVALLGPLLVGALVTAQTRSLALEARGFAAPGPRTSLYALSTGPADHLLRAAGVGTVLALGAWRVLFP
jgi:energy-coupling factor transport system permease protein